MGEREDRAEWLLREFGRDRSLFFATAIWAILTFVLVFTMFPLALFSIVGYVGAIEVRWSKSVKRRVQKAGFPNQSEKSKLSKRNVAKSGDD